MSKLVINTLFSIYALLIFGVPCAISCAPLLLLPTALWIGFIPFVYAISFPIVAGLLSLPAQKYIKEGKFPRDLSHHIYGRRRLYSFCWTSVYYSGPIYWLFLSLPWLKRILLRLFGYRGSMDISLYPDTWIRDLPILDIQQGVYLSNRSTIGTNMCLMSGEIMVKKTTIKKGALIGPSCGIGPGATIGEKSEIGFGASIGISANIGNKTHIGMNSYVSHLTRIGNNVKIGERCFLGKRVRVADNIMIPSGLVIPENTFIKSQNDIDKFVINKGDFNATINSSDQEQANKHEVLAD